MKTSKRALAVIGSAGAPEGQPGDRERARPEGGNAVQRHYRREFIRVAGVATGSVAFASLLAACEDPEPSADAGPADGGGGREWALDLPHNGGAPDTLEGWTVAAFVDTVVPGQHRDPEGSPGAIDTNTVELFYDPELPALPLIPVVAVTLDSAARALGGRFVDLTPEQREQALEGALASFPLLDLAVQLVRFGFLLSDEASDYLGYPGPNLGYWDDPNFTFGVPMATEIATDGNFP